MSVRLTPEQLAQIDARIKWVLHKSGFSQDYLIGELSATWEATIREIRASYAREDALQAERKHLSLLDAAVSAERDGMSVQMDEALSQVARLRTALEQIAVLAESWYGHSIQEEVVKIARAALQNCAKETSDV